MLHALGVVMSRVLTYKDTTVHAQTDSSSWALLRKTTLSLSYTAGNSDSVLSKITPVFIGCLFILLFLKYLHFNNAAIVVKTPELGRDSQQKSSSAYDCETRFKVTVMFVPCLSFVLDYLSNPLLHILLILAYLYSFSSVSFVNSPFL